jgi:aminomethyltransferase
MIGGTTLRTPLHDLHVQLGAKLVDFAGWEMPLRYRGIIEEHHHTRQVASVFDVSHMGRIQVGGTDAQALLQRVCTRQLGDMAPGQSRYSLVCQERGGVLDDVIVSRYERHWLVVCNASNREAITSWLQKHGQGVAAEIVDQTQATLMLAIQGPRAIPLLTSRLPMPIEQLKRYRFLTGEYFGIPYSIARSGYTGEDGIEIILPAQAASLFLGFLGELFNEPDGLRPAGLGARDTLRLEAGMPLYGHELDEQIDPLSAGLGWAVDLNKDFIGAERLRTIAQAGPEYVLVGLEVEGRRIARPGAPVSRKNDGAGRVTSGTFSPTLGRSIAMAYVQRPWAEPGEQLSVELGGRPAAAVVVKLPFYKRPKDAAQRPVTPEAGANDQ